MAKDPAFLFYSSDFLTGTMFMSNEEVGIYTRLLCAQHQHGGRIKKSDFDGAVLGFEKVREKFISDENGYYNERLETEILKRKSDSDASRNNGKKGGRPAKNKEKKPKHNLNITQQKPKHNLTENENVNEIINENELEKGGAGEKTKIIIPAPIKKFEPQNGTRYDSDVSMEQRLDEMMRDTIRMNTLRRNFEKTRDVPEELKNFRTKVLSSESDYVNHDYNGLWKALNYHMSHAKAPPFKPKTKQDNLQDLMDKYNETFFKRP